MWKRVMVGVGMAMCAAAPLQAQDGPLPGITVVRYFKCPGGADEAVRLFNEYRSVPDRFIEEGMLIDYGILRHAWGDDWDLVDYFVATDMEQFQAAWREVVRRFSELDPDGEDLARLFELCPEHKDNIYSVVNPPGVSGETSINFSADIAAPRVARRAAEPVDGRSGMAPAADLIQEAKAVIASHEDYVASGDLARTVSNFADDVLVLAAGSPLVIGRDALRTFYEDLLSMGTWNFTHNYRGAEVQGEVVELYGVATGTLVPPNMSPTSFSNSFLVVLRPDKDGRLRVWRVAFAPSAAQ